MSFYRFCKDIFLPASTAIVAIVAIIITFKTSKMTFEENAKLKEYEITFNEKRKSYAEFMERYTDLFIKSTEDKNINGIVPRKVFDSILKLEATYFGLAPFMDETGRQKCWAVLEKYEEYCLELSKHGIRLESADAIKRQFYGFRNEFIDIFDKKLITKKTSGAAPLDTLQK